MGNSVQTNSNTVVVSAASTFGGLVDINAGGQANTFKVEDLTDNRVVIVGTGLLLLLLCLVVPREKNHPYTLVLNPSNYL